MIRFILISAVVVASVTAGGMHISTVVAADTPKSTRSESHRWETAVKDLREGTHDFLGHLKSVRAALIERAENEDPSLIRRLHIKKPIRHGYGVQPDIVKELPERSVALLKTNFSLEALAARTKRDKSALARLLRRAASTPEEPLDRLVKEFERLRGRLRNLESNLSYHTFWQRSVLRIPRYYAGRNNFAKLIGELMAVRKQSTEPDRLAALEQQVRSGVTPFRKIRPGLAPIIKATGDGALVLTITIFTDIADANFLKTFNESVRDLISGSKAARKKRFSIDLRLQRISSGELYPKGAPSSSAPVDRRTHLARFPKDAYVLTTGGSSTHVYTDRMITLGPAPATRRTLAHEFLHLLGFPDTYVRSFTGNSKDPFGVTLVEWTGLTDDIMSSPGYGRVSDDIIETIISAYSLNEDATR